MVTVLKYSFLFLLIIALALPVYSSEKVDYEKAVIQKILEKKVFSKQMQIDTGLICQYKLSVKISSTGKIVTVDYAVEKILNKYDIHPFQGDRIILRKEFNSDDKEYEYNFEEFDRIRILFYLVLLFFIIVLVFTGIKGLYAIFALLLSLGLIFYLFIPMILNGYPAIWSAVLVCGLSTVITLVIIAGFGIKSVSAILGTLGGVISAATIAVFVGYFSKITGLYEQELYLLSTAEPQLNIRNLIISGFIIGALGATMDVAMSISSSMFEIYTANAAVKFKELYRSGISIGKDIVGTMINTLILAYTGSSFSILLLFYINKKDYPLTRIVNFEMIFLELVKSLSGCIGMLVSIPLTAVVASVILTRKCRT